MEAKQQVSFMEIKERGLYVLFVEEYTRMYDGKNHLFIGFGTEVITQIKEIYMYEARKEDETLHTDGKEYTTEEFLKEAEGLSGDGHDLCIVFKI